MPHVEIKYSDDLDIDTKQAFDLIEQIINEQDASAGVCKSRAYPCSQYKYPHILIVVSLLTKPYRDQEFTNDLSEKIAKEIKKLFKQSLYFSLNIEYSSANYTTNVHLVEGDKLQAMEDSSSS
ncbi:tautomerase family protein [Shewanella violacea]|uniref:5-carboxymethyl-2-hydroxymuconate delta isomerase n=1 Tax=Shewanella violacea (strain JCM 10179 / CIP 106290 / LMG 19151 / DSS12) TaxID=637905 RepID=D4ZMM1_SHEVD|nr:hypothetical protein [Shewanella violacea]BAJ02920.1 hypothetical protein SVI_2949 [Shewanella violacea DSS12]